MARRWQQRCQRWQVTSRAPRMSGESCIARSSPLNTPEYKVRDTQPDWTSPAEMKIVTDILLNLLGVGELIENLKTVVEDKLGRNRRRSPRSLLEGKVSDGWLDGVAVPVAGQQPRSRHPTLYPKSPGPAPADSHHHRR